MSALGAEIGVTIGALVALAWIGFEKWIDCRKDHDPDA